MCSYIPYVVQNTLFIIINETKPHKKIKQNIFAQYLKETYPPNHLFQKEGKNKTKTV